MKTLVFLVGSAIALAVPFAASAQGYYGYDGDPQGYDSGGYERSHGDYYGNQQRMSGYPEFRQIESHIRSEIREGLRSGDIEQDDARDLMGRLRQIQAREYREFQFHGWNLPDDDRRSIRAQLDSLDNEVDEMLNS